MVTNAFSALGASVMRLFFYHGQLAFLFMGVIKGFFIGKVRLRLIGQQLVSIGFGSQVVVIVTGACTGAVFAAQTYFKFSELGLGSAVGPVVSLAMCRELGPVLAGLMVSGRVGAAMAAEIGTMKVTEQTDALRAMGVHPTDYLVLPRVVGMFISMPLLVAECIGFGMLAAHLLAVYGFNVPAAWYDHHVASHTELQDIGIGMIKGFIFGGIIVLVSCHQGLTAKNGAVGVGQGTTNAVVISSLSILVSNFFLSILLNFFFPLGAGG